MYAGPVGTADRIPPVIRRAVALYRTLDQYVRRGVRRTVRPVEDRPDEAEAGSIRQRADAFRRAADEHHRRSPMHAALCAALASDVEILELLDAAPASQRIPVLLLAALHDSVLAEPTCSLAEWYPTVVATPRSDDLTSAVHRHIRSRMDGFRDVLSRRSVQTNEVGRCGVLLPALAAISGEFGPLALVDVGASAGLNLHLDRFRYHFRPGGTVGPASPVEVTVGCRGRVPIPRALPSIDGRIGLDQNPIDLADPVERRWLRACIWPDQIDRFRRLEAAIDIALDAPAIVRRGDAVDDLREVIGALSGSGHIVIVNTWCLSYLTPQQRADYLDTLDGLGRQQDLSWVFAESPADTPELPTHPSMVGRSVTALTAVQWRNARRSVRHLAVAHPHGYWMHWHEVD